MRNVRKAAVLVATLGSIGLLGAGTAHADMGVQQSSNCKSHDLNVDVLGQIGILNGLLGNALNGEGNAGGQGTHLGSTMGCGNGGW